MIIQGDMHTHTIASTHAYSTILENCKCASEYGLKGLAMTDHAVAMPDSPHIWHFTNLGCLPRKICGVTVLRGAEVDIMGPDGNLDMEGPDLSALEWVVASMHQPCFRPQDSSAHTKAYLNLCKNPYVDVIGHCTTTSFPFDYEKCVKAFKEYGKIVEINESSYICKRSPKENYVKILELCKKYEVPVVVDSDSHFCQRIGQVPEVTKIIEEIDFPERLVLNSDWEKIREHVLKKHPDIEI